MSLVTRGKYKNHIFAAPGVIAMDINIYSNIIT